MANISNEIEKFLLSMIGEENEIQIIRNELASYFSVAPSQINYVLATRFNSDKGYMIESQRGGGGYVTIIKLQEGKNAILNQLVKELDNIEYLSVNRANNIVDRLYRDGIIDQSNAMIIKSAISDNALGVPVLLKEALRKKIFKEIMTTLARR